MQNGHRDEHTLRQAHAQLVGVQLQELGALGQARLFKSLADGLFPVNLPVGEPSLAHLLADGHGGIEHRQRALHHHGEAMPAIGAQGLILETEQLDALKPYLAARAAALDAGETEQGAGDRALARAAGAHQADNVARFHPQLNVADHTDAVWVIHAEVGGKQRGAGRSRGSGGRGLRWQIHWRFTVRLDSWFLAGPAPGFTTSSSIFQ